MKPKRKSSKPQPSRAVVRHHKPNGAITKPVEVTIAESIEKVLITGDLSPLSPDDRVKYYNAVCKSLGLNPMTVPFYYLVFKEYGDDDAQQGQQTGGKLQLYANKSCAEQLRKIHGISVVGEAKRYVENDIIYSEVMVQDRTGRTDRALGAVPIYKFKRISGSLQRIKLSDRELANAWMKADTKARRRATLSICGLSFLDESELDTMNVVGGVTPQGRIYYYDSPTPELPASTLREDAPHGHAPGSEKAKQAQAQLDKVEEEDRKFREQSARPKPVGRIEFDFSGDGDPVVRGDLGGIAPELESKFGMRWQNEWYRVPVDNVAAARKRCEELNYEVVIIQKPSGNKASGQRAASGDTTKGQRRGSARAESAAAPVVISGTIERIQVTMTKQNQPMAHVTLAMADGKKPSFGVFDKDIWEFLEKGKGLLAEVQVIPSGQYFNIVGLLRIGSRAFIDGKTPVVDRNEERGGNLFEK